MDTDFLFGASSHLLDRGVVARLDPLLHLVLVHLGRDPELDARQLALVVVPGRECG